MHPPGARPARPTNTPDRRCRHAARTAALRNRSVPPALLASALAATLRATAAAALWLDDLAEHAVDALEQQVTREGAHNLCDLLLDLCGRDTGPLSRRDAEAEHGQDGERHLRLLVWEGSLESDGEGTDLRGLLVPARGRKVRRAGPVAARQTQENLDDYGRDRDESADPEV